MAKSTSKNSFVSGPGVVRVDGKEIALGGGAQLREDGWLNLLAGMGGGKDRRTNTTHKAGPYLGEAELESLYRFSGFAKKVVDIPAYEMTREWIAIENDDDNAGLQKLAELDAKNIFRDVIKWGNLFGGALVIMGIDDGGDLETPLNESGIRDVSFLRVYDRFQISWTSSDINGNPESRLYGLPEFYTVNAYSTGNSFRVHASRVLRHNGSDVPERSRVKNQGWGDSVLQAVYEELRDYGIIKASSVSIVQDFVQTILQIENLTQLLSQEGGDALVKKRLDLIDLSRSVMNTILLDAGEQYTKQASTVTGLDALIGQFALALSAVTGIPVTKLFGQAPAGLNATGESDIRNFYDEMKSQQEDVLLPMLEQLFYLIQISKDGPYKGKVNPEAAIVFNPLWQMDDKQEAEWKKTIAQTDEIYIKNGVLAPEEIAVSRFANGFSSEIEIDISQRKEPETEPENEPEKQ